MRFKIEYYDVKSDEWKACWNDVRKDGTIADIGLVAHLNNNDGNIHRVTKVTTK